MTAIDRSGLSGHDLVLVLRAHHRLVSHYQAEMYADMAGVAARVGEELGDPSASESYEAASAELRAALHLTRRRADWELGLALELSERLPELREAMASGAIDLPRAKVILEGTAHLPLATARGMVEGILPEAARLTSGELVARIRRLCLDMDPGEAEIRYEKGLAERRVVAEANPDGTAHLYGLWLPPHRVSAITRRINELAMTLKEAADPRTLDQIRADVYLDLLQGKELRAGGGSVRGVVDLRVDLTTLAGLDEKAGEIPGWGPVISDIARQVARDQRESQWRVTVTHPDTGLPAWQGSTRRRPNLGERRWVETRFPTCVFPGCRMPASECDLDHNVAWSKGGATVEENLAPLCRHDHGIKHRGRWRLERTKTGHYTWTSLLGHTYTTSGLPP